MANFYASYPIEGGGNSPILTVSDTNSIDLTITSSDLTADLKLSAAAATGTNLKITNSIESDGLLSQIPRASASVDGYLFKTDWSTFNSKQNQLPNFAANFLLYGDGTDVPVSTSDFQIDHSTSTLNIGAASSSSNGNIVVGGSGTGIGNITGGGGALNIIGGPLTLSTHSAAQSIIFKPGTSTSLTLATDLSAVFAGNVSGANLSGTNTGNVTLGTANGLSIPGQVLSLALSSTSTTGALSNTDWNTFNGKQASGSYITALTGEVTAAGPGSVAATIAAGVITNAKVSASAAIDFSKLAALTSAHILVGSAGNVATDVAVTGDISLTNAGVTAYSGTVPLNKGGTGQTTKAPAFDALSPMSAVGDLILGSTSGTGTRLGIGSNTFVLTSNGTTASWAANAAAALVTQGAAGLVASAGQLLGISSTTDASAGNVGEYIDATVTSQTNTGNQNEFWDATSITLTAGDWDVSGDIEYVRNGATMTDIDLEVGISGTTGNSSTGLTNGINKNLWGLGGNLLTFGRITIPVGPIRVKSNGTQLIIAGTTTTGQVAYLKALIGTYSAGQPQYRASVRARRVR